MRLTCSDGEELEQITVFDKVKQWETECYYSPKIKNEEGKWRVECEFSHITFGFYEVQIQFTSGWYYRIDLIKYYPDYLKEKYQLLIQEDSTSRKSTFTPRKEIGIEIAAFQKVPVSVTTDLGVNDEVLNEALALTTEWGANFMKPIAERLRKKYPEISREQAEKLQAYCREAESYMHDLGMKEDGEISESAMVPLAQHKYPWVKTEHWYRLKNIAMFYARK